MKINNIDIPNVEYLVVYSEEIFIKFEDIISLSSEELSSLLKEISPSFEFRYEKESYEGVNARIFINNAIIAQ
jgi:hypothetical protein